MYKNLLLDMFLCMNPQKKGDRSFGTFSLQSIHSVFNYSGSQVSALQSYVEQEPEQSVGLLFAEQFLELIRGCSSF